jgi:competence protein ComEA
MKHWWSLMYGRAGGFMVAGVALILTGGLSATLNAQQQPQLPDGPGKDALVKVCVGCHEPNRVAAFRLTREGWEATVADMRWRGAKATDEEFTAIVDYLAANFLGEAAPKLNMNRATSIELESVLSLLRKEAAAVIAYRDKVGGFKTIDDLKKVPGLDFKKIESGKDRISF